MNLAEEVGAGDLEAGLAVVEEPMTQMMIIMTVAGWIEGAKVVDGGSSSNKSSVNSKLRA